MSSTILKEDCTVAKINRNDIVAESTTNVLHLGNADNDENVDIICCSPIPINNHLDDSQGSMKLVIDESIDQTNKSSEDLLKSTTKQRKSINNQDIKMDNDDVMVIEIDDDDDDDGVDDEIMESLLPLPLSVELHSDTEVIEIDDVNQAPSIVNTADNPEESNILSSKNYNGKEAGKESQSSENCVDNIDLKIPSKLPNANVNELENDEIVSFSLLSVQDLKQMNPVENNDLLMKISSPLQIDGGDVLKHNNSNMDGIFYNKYCINYDCSRRDKQFVIASLFALSYYKILRKNEDKVYYLCMECNYKSIEIYEVF